MNIEIRLFYGPSDWGWVLQHLPLKRTEDTCGLMAVDLTKNETVGACIFDNFLYNSCQASIILKTPMVLKHGFLEECFDMIFEGFGRDYIYCLIAENNRASMDLNRHLGFKIMSRIIQGYSHDVDYIVTRLHKDDCLLYKNYLREVA